MQLIFENIFKYCIYDGVLSISLYTVVLGMPINDPISEITLNLR